MRFSHDISPSQMQAPIIEAPIYRRGPVEMPVMPIPAYPQVPPMPNYAPTVGLAQPEAPAPMSAEAMIGAAVDQAYQEAGWDLAKTPAALGMPEQEQLTPVMASAREENGDLSWFPGMGSSLHEGGTTSSSPADNGSGASSGGRGGRGGRGHGRGWSGGGGSGNDGGNNSGNQGGESGPNEPDNEFIRHAADAAVYAVRVGSVTPESVQRELGVSEDEAARIFVALQDQGVIISDGRCVMVSDGESAAAAKVQVGLRHQQVAVPQAPAAPQSPQPVAPPRPAQAPTTPQPDTSGDTSTGGRSLTGVFKNLATRTVRATRDALIDSGDNEHEPFKNAADVLDTYTAHLPKKAFETHNVSVAQDAVAVRAELVEEVQSRLSNNGWRLSSDNLQVLGSDGQPLPNDDPRAVEILAYQEAIAELAPKIDGLVKGLFNNYDASNPDTFNQLVALGHKLGEGKDAEALGEEVFYQYNFKFDAKQGLDQVLQNAGYKVENGTLSSQDGSLNLPVGDFYQRLQAVALAESFKAKGLRVECGVGTHDTKDLRDFTLKVTDASGADLVNMPHVTPNKLYEELSSVDQTTTNTTGSFRLPPLLRRSRTTEPATTPVVPATPEATPAAAEEESSLPQELADALKGSSLSTYSGEELVKAAARMGIKREEVDRLMIGNVNDDTIVIVDPRGNFIFADREIFETEELYRNRILRQVQYLGSAERTTNPDARLEIEINEPLRPNRSRLNNGNTMLDYLEEVHEGSVMARLRSGLYGLRGAVSAAGQARQASRRQRRAAAAATAPAPTPPSPEDLRRKRMLRRRAATATAALGLVASAVLGVFASENSGSEQDSATSQPSVSASQAPHASASHHESTKPSPSRTHASETAPAPTTGPTSRPSEEAPHRAGGGSDNHEQPSAPKGETRIVHAGNETVTFADDGSVVITLQKGGTFSEGISAAQQDMAERHLKVDTSTAATYNAVQSMHLKPGEDRKQHVGATYTFAVGKNGQLSMKETR